MLESKAPRFVRAAVAVVGLALLLWANYFLRHTLEESDRRIYSFFETFYAAVDGSLFDGSQPWWKLLVPIPELGGSWTTTTLVVTRLIELRLTPPVTWYVFNAALMIASFITSWAAFRSLVFSFTFTICMGFGTQLYSTYGVPGTMGLCLFLIYYELVLLTGFRVIQGATPALAWRSAFVLSVLVMAMGYEGWLDFAAFMWLAAVFIAVAGYRLNKREWWPGLAFATGCLAVTCAAYLCVKLSLGYGQTPGAESDVIFNYPTLAPKVEDFLSNVIRQFYLVITNFLPASFVSSTTFLTLGGQELVELQHGYHGRWSYLVVMQHLFLWRYYAGAAFVVFCYLMFRTLKRALQAWSPDMFAASVFLLMIAVGGPTHAIVKARPMNSMPVLGYHVIVGVLGLSLLLSLLAKVAIASPRRGLGAVAVGAMWIGILYSALSRPAMLGHMAAQVGLGEGLYPDPRSTLAALLGRPVTHHAGAASYSLTPYDPAAAVPASSAPVTRTFGGPVEPLPTLAPPVDQWTATTAVAVAPSDRGYRIAGNESIGGYQISSPLISVPPNQRVLVRLQGRILEGRACLGVMDQTSQRWLVPPADDRGELAFDTRANEAVMLTFINCSVVPGPVVFEVESLSYAVLMNAPEASGR